MVKFLPIVSQKYILLLAMSLISGCTCWVRTWIPKEVKVGIKHCYDGTSSGLDSKIRIDGYYSLIQNFNRWDNALQKQVPASQEIKLIFYSDGLFLWNYWRWGNYIVVGDTIKVNYYDPPCGMAWSGVEQWYLINPDKTLTKLFSTSMRNLTDARRSILVKALELDSEINSIASFHESDSLQANCENWLLDAKWFRCKEGKK